MTRCALKMRHFCLTSKAGSDITIGSSGQASRAAQVYRLSEHLRDEQSVDAAIVFLC